MSSLYITEDEEEEEDEKKKGDFMSAFSKSASAVTLGPNSLSKPADKPEPSLCSQL